MSSAPRLARGCWLPGEESNLHQGIQSPLCYRYTTRHPVRIQSRQAALSGDSLIGEDGAFEPS